MIGDLLRKKIDGKCNYNDMVFLVDYTRIKTFEDIKEGVVMIINRAERDLSVQDYHKEIKKMIDLIN